MKLDAKHKIMPTKKEATKAWAVMIYNPSAKQWSFLGTKTPSGCYLIASSKGEAEQVKEIETNLGIIERLKIARVEITILEERIKLKVGK